MNLIHTTNVTADLAYEVQAQPRVGIPLQDKIRIALDAIKQQIIEGKHPCCSFSGGKDSSVTLNLAITAVRELKSEGVKVPTLHIIHSDTGVENPVVAAYNRKQIQQIRAYGKRSGVALKVWVCSPNLSNDYLVALIGGRTIMSVGSSTKCQQMMKASALTQGKRRIKQYIADANGGSYTPGEIVSLIGTRFDESATRATRMTARGESSVVPVNLDAESGGDNWILSPIADLSTMEVFEYIGMVRSGKIECYDPFDDLVELYRDLNNGDCMVNVFLAGKSGPRSGCSNRTGCWTCGRISKDSSAEALIADDQGRYSWLRPLNQLRNYMMARHNDPAARNWLSRTVDPVKGTIKIAPNSYSPSYTRELLGLVLTIQRDEEHQAEIEGRAPHFQLLNTSQLIAVDLLWSRHAYNQPFTAAYIWDQVYRKGVSYRIPAPIPSFPPLNTNLNVEVPFADEHYEDIFSGFRSLAHAAADAESLVVRKGVYMTDAYTGDEFEIDAEAAELFWEFELDRVLEKYPRQAHIAPAAAFHHLIGLGTVTLFKGSHTEMDRILRLGNQIHRHNLAPILHDPVALIEELSQLRKAGKVVQEDVQSATPGQIPLFA